MTNEVVIEWILFEDLKIFQVGRILHDGVIYFRLTIQFLQWLDSLLHPLHSEEGSEVGSVAGDDDESEEPPDSSNNPGAAKHRKY